MDIRREKEAIKKNDQSISTLMGNAVVRITVTPAGVIDGMNAVFTLPSGTVTDLFLFKNGLLQTQGVDFNLDGNVITFMPSNLPQVGNILLARVSMPLQS